MAHSPISRPDPFDPVGPSPVRETSGTERASESGRAESLSQWVSTLTAFGGGSLAADLALDLVLNDIGERARAATNATAAAIALARNGEIVCRATTGENAPDLGVPLNIHSGLSAACVQTWKWQHSEDTELDDRVDREVCRRLGVRSILVFPILKKRELLGVIEIFSSRPRALSNREIGVLETLAREVVESVDRAAAVQAISPAPESTPDASLESLQPAVPVVRTRDFWNDALSLLVIALALVLGWVVGRGGWRNTTTNRSPQGKQVSQSSDVAASNVAVSSAGPERPEEAAGARLAGGGSDRPAPESGLTVYQNGKVVFRTPTRAHTQGDVTTGVVATTDRATDAPVPRLRISPDIANEYVVQRVEPEYPEQARARGIQGPVVIDVIVGKGGGVENLTAVSGNAQLQAAAINAIRQWRFQPFFRNGQPEAFQTRVTLDFRLP